MAAAVCTAWNGVGDAFTNDTNAFAAAGAFANVEVMAVMDERGDVLGEDARFQFRLDLSTWQPGP